MEQLPMFDQPTVTIWHKSQAGNRRRLSYHFVWVEDETGDTIIGVEYEGRGWAGLKRAMIEKAREAYQQINVRPYGDEYNAGEFHVYYIYEMRDCRKVT